MALPEIRDQDDGIFDNYQSHTGLDAIHFTVHTETDPNMVKRERNTDIKQSTALMPLDLGHGYGLHIRYSVRIRQFFEILSKVNGV